MNNVLVVLPESWKIDKIRYLQLGEEVYVCNADLLDSPLDTDDSILNYKSYVLKQDGPTGFRVQ